jgi:hypothetical protein
MFTEQILNYAELETFEKCLMPHQKSVSRQPTVLPA